MGPAERASRFPGMGEVEGDEAMTDIVPKQTEPCDICKVPSSYRMRGLDGVLRFACTDHEPEFESRAFPDREPCPQCSVLWQRKHLQQFNGVCIRCFRSDD